MMKALFVVLQFAFIYTLSEAQSSILQPQADKSFNITYIQVRCFIPNILLVLVWFSIISLSIYWSLCSFFSFLVLKEFDKLFVHGCFNNKLFLYEIHARSDQYFFWWRLWESGSFFTQFNSYSKFCRNFCLR